MKSRIIGIVMLAAVLGALYVALDQPQTQSQPATAKAQDEAALKSLKID